jgi:hypothetical protein
MAFSKLCAGACCRQGQKALRQALQRILSAETDAIYEIADGTVDPIRSWAQQDAVTVEVEENVLFVLGPQLFENCTGSFGVHHRVAP